MLRKLLSAVLFGLIIQFQIYAQDKTPVKFGHVLPEDFNISKRTVDTAKGAIVICEQGYSSFEGNEKGWFNMVFEFKTRILITSKSGIDLANVEIPLYRDGESEEKVTGIKAVTYNLENDKVVETKLKSDGIFDDKYDRNYLLKKFTLPVVKEGSIIEYSYRVSSDFFFNLRSWDFQGKYPIEWSEYEVNIPEYFEYVTLAQGYMPFFIKTESNGRGSYNLRVNDGDFGGGRMITVTGNTTDKRWVMKNVPAISKEEFVTTDKNYVSRIEMQLAGIRIPNEPYRNIMGSWTTAADQLLKEDDFGTGLDKNNGWLNDSMKIITSGATSTLDKAKKVYYYVRNNFKSTEKNGIFIRDNNTLKDVFKKKNGSVAEINLLLIAMLRHEGITADPVILSTRANGNPQPFYPLLKKYNYLICKTDIDTATFYLDAAKSYLGFGRLSSFCYNGPARVVDKLATPIAFLPDTLQENKTINVMLFNDSSVTGKWQGNIVSNLTYIESERVREKVADKGIEDYKKEERSSLDDYSFSNIEVKDLKNYENPVEVNCDVAVTSSDTGAVIYFSPIIKNWYKENPLKSAERQYPVEMPSLINETYTLYMEIPKGYVVDELPKSAKVSFNESDALFEYYISKDDANVNLKSHIQFSKATFTPEEYKDLRSFFDYIVKKNTEQIVFKRKK